ncbi:Retrovirus-related Pol polyprotein from transposon TNT [Apis cerana cerana]|uniref:Retrovirus-related Pol polyprotein from transposon TNT n=1 Tax=Apis cerana cerana TaxID=94128 RepID=A0A2A3EFS0_APICC|nr:Retrovirus-related Pol polyprotein from transposon TNT [Apis cerana cerana]
MEAFTIQGKTRDFKQTAGVDYHETFSPVKQQNMVFIDSAIAWGAIQQLTVALSTIKAEYIVASQIVKEIIWMKNLINDLTIFNYNDSLQFHQRNKHIDVRYHFIRNKFNEKDFLLQHIASGESAGRPSENRENI